MTGSSWTGHFVRKELLIGKHSSSNLIPSFELAFATLIKTLEKSLSSVKNNDENIIEKLVDNRVFLPKILTSINQMKESGYKVRMQGDKVKKVCKLNNVLIYETFLLPSSLLENPVSS